MPRTRSDDWSSMGIPATPLQRGAYLDACTAWLTSEPSSEYASGDEARESTEAATPPPKPLAIARISSTTLRRVGLYNPREGAAVALPLSTAAGERLPPPAALPIGAYDEVAQPIVDGPRGRVRGEAPMQVRAVVAGGATAIAIAERALLTSGNDRGWSPHRP